jgi:hypothetical protein
MPQYYNIEKANQQFYNQNLLANYQSNYQAANLANYYHLNEIDNNLVEAEKANDNKDTSISKSEHEDENEAPITTSINPRSKNNNNKKSSSNNNYSNPSYLMQPPDSESIAVAAANASANRSKRRVRTKFDKKQLDTLESAFERAHYPDVNQIICLSEMLNISTERISVWFQNRRARFKRSKKETNPPSSFSDSSHLIENQLKSFLNNDENDDEDENKETPLKNNNHLISNATKNMIENMKSINEIENQLSSNSAALIIPKPQLHPISYNQQQLNPYQISNLTSSDKVYNVLPIIKITNEKSNGGTSNNESSSSITSTPSRSRSNTPESYQEKSHSSVKQFTSNIFHSYPNYPQFSLPHPGMLPYPHPPAPPTISLTSPDGSISNPLGRQYQPPLQCLGQIFQPFIDRISQDESSYYALNLNNNINNNNNNNIEESNSTSPNSTRSRSASSFSSSENDNKENSNSNDEYDNQAEKQYNNHYSQMFVSSMQPAASSAHLFNHLHHQQQLINQSSNGMNAFKQHCNLPSISQIFQPYAACGSNNQESSSYY